MLEFTAAIKTRKMFNNTLKLVVMKKTTMIIALSFCFFGIKAQDTVWLKSDKTIEGSIVSFANKKVSIKAGNETFVYKLEEIKSIHYNGSVKKTNEPTEESFPIKTSKKPEEEMRARPVKTGK